MNVKKLIASVLLPVVLPGAAMAAQASFTISGVNVNLIDLDTTDGVTPSISFFNEQSYGGYKLYQPPQYFDYIGNGTLSGTVSNSSPWGNAEASAGPKSFNITVETLQPNVTAELSGYTKASFTLSKNTLAIFSLPYSVSLAKSTGEYLDTSFNFYAAVPGSYFDMDYTFRRGQVSSTLFGQVYTGSSAGQGYFSASTDIYTNTSGTPPVPEPGTYAMLLAGLGVIGWRLRQRNGTAA